MGIGIGKSILGLLIGLAIFSGVAAEDFANLDEAIPKGGNTVNYAPAFDFDTDGCLPSAGISRDGAQNPGLALTGNPTADCYGVDPENFFLPTSNTYHRYACITGVDGLSYCGHFYALYFEKDQGGPFAGHTHDWEYAAIWTTEGVPTHVSASAHGSLDTRPIDEVLFLPITVPDGKKSPAIVYHWQCGAIPWCIGGSHALRFADTCDVFGSGCGLGRPAGPENPHESFVTPAIASWYELVGDGFGNREMRQLLDSYDYEHATIPLKDGLAPLNDNTFLNELNGTNGTCVLCPNKGQLKRPPNYPEFTLDSIRASNPNNPVLKFIAGDGALSGEGTEYFLDFGHIPRGRYRLIAELAVENAVAESADTLDGDFDTAAAAPYLTSGFDNFTGLEAGDLIDGLIVEIPTAGYRPGVVTGEIVLQPKGQVDTGERKPLEPITLSISMEIVRPGIKTGVCDGQIGAAYGLCTAYYDANHCQYKPVHGKSDSKSCKKIARNFMRITGIDITSLNR